MARKSHTCDILLLLLILLADQSKSEFTPKVIDRHNYGLVLTKRSEVQVATLTGKMIFHYQLPPQMNVSVEKVNCSLFSVSRHSHNCQVLEPLLRAFIDMEFRAAVHLQMQLDNIYEVLHDLAPGRISKRGFLTDAIGKVTGLATKAEVADLVRLLTKVEEGMVQSVNAWTAGTKGILSAFHIIQARFDDVYRLMQMQRKSLKQLQSELLRVFLNSQRRSTMQAQIFTTLGAHMFQISEIDHLYNAVNMLSVGKIPHLFISHQAISRSLAYLDAYLNRSHPDLTILRKDTSYYYQQATFKTFRYNSRLVIIIDVPLTSPQLLKPLDLFQVTTFPLLSPSGDTHYTKLSVDFEGIAYHADVDAYMVIPKLSQTTPEIINLQNSDLFLRSRNVPACPITLIEGTLEAIKAHCNYHVFTTSLPRGVFKISPHMFLLSNITQVTLYCYEKSVVHEIEVNESQLFFQLPCACELRADEYYVISSSSMCVAIDNVTLHFHPSFLINLPYLTEFINNHYVLKLQDDSYLNESISAMLPSLAVASKAYDANLAIEKTSRYDLNRIVNLTKDDVLSYESLSHYIYNSLLFGHTHNETFDVFNAFDWLLVLATFTGIFALILVVILHFKVRTLFLLLASSGHARADVANPHTLKYHLTSSSAPSPTADYMYYHRTIQRLFPVDLTLLFCLILFFIFCFGYLYYKYKKSIAMRTSLMLEISDGERSYTYTVTSLSYPPSFYRFTVSQQLIDITLNEFFFGIRLHWGPALQVQNIPLDMPVDIPSAISIPLWQITRIRRILRGEYFACIHILNVNNDLQDLIVLHPRVGEAKTIGSSLTNDSRVPSLYPVLQ